jgi:hypothetical protein
MRRIFKMKYELKLRQRFDDIYFVFEDLEEMGAFIDAVVKHQAREDISISITVVREEEEEADVCEG